MGRKWGEGRHDQEQPPSGLGCRGGDGWLPDQAAKPWPTLLLPGGMFFDFTKGIQGQGYEILCPAEEDS